MTIGQAGSAEAATPHDPDKLSELCSTSGLSHRGDFFEDIVVGTCLDLGSHTFTREEIIDFAWHFDPQPFHLDDEAAERSALGRIAASGWHTAAIWMKLYAGHRNAVRQRLLSRGETPAAPGPSPGFRDMRWRIPVHPGDTLTYRSVVSAKRTLPKRDWGLVFHHNTGVNQHGQVAVEFHGSVFWQRRAALEFDQNAG